ncbi:two pore domain potassium channel family protein [Candidatus Woesearchaeota archaeon]|nr:two pore domain potassium channel family protein [Candidatus Woesearchaeota archaeon]
MKKVFAALVAVLAVGTVGYVLIEKMQFPDALLSAVSVMATVGIPEGLTAAGKLFTTALIIASVSIIITAVYRFFNPPVEEGEEALSGFFSQAPQPENLLMKELSITGKSPLAGLQKGQIIQKYGVVVVGVKRKGGFDINVPLTARVKSGSSVIVLGSPATILGVEKKRK